MCCELECIYKKSRSIVCRHFLDNLFARSWSNHHYTVSILDIISPEEQYLTLCKSSVFYESFALHPHVYVFRRRNEQGKVIALVRMYLRDQYESCVLQNVYLTNQMAIAKALLVVVDGFGGTRREFAVASICAFSN
jgi:hypothetical protein